MELESARGNFLPDIIEQKLNEIKVFCGDLKLKENPIETFKGDQVEAKANLLLDFPLSIVPFHFTCIGN